jgi:hypothetical protein
MTKRNANTWVYYEIDLPMIPCIEIQMEFYIVVNKKWLQIFEIIDFLAHHLSCM